MAAWLEAGCEAQLANLYGTTECSSWSFALLVPRDAVSVRTLAWQCQLPIGDALDATEWAVRPLGGPGGEDVAEGEGELYMGGLARRCCVGSPTAAPLRYSAKLAARGVARLALTMTGVDSHMSAVAGCARPAIMCMFDGMPTASGSCTALAAWIMSLSGTASAFRSKKLRPPCAARWVQHRHIARMMAHTSVCLKV